MAIAMHPFREGADRLGSEAGPGARAARLLVGGVSDVVDDLLHDRESRRDVLPTTPAAGFARLAIGSGCFPRVFGVLVFVAGH
jgi:hypothetical protein